MSKIVHLTYPPEKLEDAWRFYRLKKTAEILTKNCHGLLLDIGCNDCLITKFIPKERFSYLGIDLSRQALRKGKPQQRILTDACNLPFPDQCVDTVSCFEIIEHLQEPHQLMREIARVLKPNGKLLVSTPNQQSLFLKIQNTVHLPRFHDWRYVETHYQTFTPQTLDSLLKQYGFVITKKIRSIAFPPFKITKKSNVYKVLRVLSKVVPEDSQELLIRLAMKTKPT
ncbi:MAG: class I SAM-dependent methyltransferase [Candidatus Bathyarchaeia archaeon]